MDLLVFFCNFCYGSCSLLKVLVKPSFLGNNYLYTENPGEFPHLGEKGQKIRELLVVLLLCCCYESESLMGAKNLAVFAGSSSFLHAGGILRQKYAE